MYNYAAHATDILTPTTVARGVDKHSRGLYCRRCYCIRKEAHLKTMYYIWHVIIYPFTNFSGATFEVLEWISNFNPHLTGYVLTYLWWD